MLLSTGLLALLCLSCADRDPLSPDRADTLLQVSTATYEQGCTRLEVSVSGQDRVEVKTAAPHSCGALVPVMAGVPTFDRTRGLVRLPVALENRAERKVKAPAWLLGWEDSLSVVSPAGLSGNRHAGEYLAFRAADSMASAADTVLRGGQIWNYDEILAGSGEVQTLGPGTRSQVRWIGLSVHSGIETFRVVLHARAQRASMPMPALPPDSVPQWVEDSIRYSKRGFAPGVVRVGFQWSTPVEAKQRAIDAVGGEVIGGERYESGADYEGVYYILVPSDGSLEALDRAAALLEGLPYVEFVNPAVGRRGETLFLKPHDGPEWQDWQVHDTVADGRNWGLEAISTPLAWGCETGSEHTPIAVVDRDFDSIPQISYGRNLGLGAFSSAGDSTVDHGTAVSSIIGARGNDSIGITGGMWRSRLRVYDVAVDSLSGKRRVSSTTKMVDWGFTDFDIMHRVRMAARDGAKIVNISLGVPVQVNDTVTLRRAYRTIRDGWRRIPPEQRPLLIIGAGNEGVDAKWSTLPLLARDYPAHVIVAGAVEMGSSGSIHLLHDTLGARIVQTNAGTLVSVLAPGGRVAALNGAGDPRTWSGTSFATPHVTAIAGLLLAFDSTLTPAQIRELIIGGAERRNRRVGGIPLANAHESLKLAAQRRGAPLCGNRLWFQDGYLRASRGSGSEALAPAPEQAYGVAPLHGGRKFQIIGSDGDVTYERQSSGRWAATSTTEWYTTPEVAGTLRSTFNRSHGVDTAAWAAVRPDGYVHVGLELPDGTLRLLNTSLYRPNKTTELETCVAIFVDSEGNTRCDWERPQRSYTSTSYDAQVSYSPMGDRLLLVINRRGETRRYLDWFRCIDRIPEGTWRIIGPEHLCRDEQIDYASEGGEAFSVRISDGQLTPLPWARHLTYFLLGTSEDGTETSVRASAGNSRLTYGYVSTPLHDGTPYVTWSYLSGTGGSGSCAQLFLDVQSGAEQLRVPCASHTHVTTPFSANRIPVAAGSGGARPDAPSGTPRSLPASRTPR